MMIIILIMGHKHIKGTVWGDQQEVRGVKEMILRGEEGRSTIMTSRYEDSIMKPTNV
jgi:hypothetical protein